jgi:hypothetical protein
MNGLTAALVHHPFPSIPTYQEKHKPAFFATELHLMRA